MGRLLHRLLARHLGRLFRPVVRLLAVLAVAGVAIAVFDLMKGVFVGSSSVPEKVLLIALSIGLVVLAAPIINAARPVSRRDRP